MKNPSITNLLKAAPAIAAAVALSGCATAFTGTESEVSIKSTPPNADAYASTADGQSVYLGKTPLTAKVPKESRALILKKSGYEDASVPTGRKFAFFPFALDIFCWPTFIVDAYTGACYELKPEHDVRLSPQKK